MIIKLPDIDFEAAKHNGKRYLLDKDVESWLLECSKVAKDNGLIQAEEFVIGLVQCLLRVK